MSAASLSRAKSRETENCGSTSPPTPRSLGEAFMAPEDTQSAGWGRHRRPMRRDRQRHHAGAVVQFVRHKGQLGDGGARAGRIASRSAARRQAEKQAMADHVALVMGTVERGHVEHQVFDALLDEPFDGLPRQVRRHELGVVAGALARVVGQGADDRRRPVPPCGPWARRRAAGAWRSARPWRRVADRCSRWTRARVPAPR